MWFRHDENGTGMYTLGIGKLDGHSRAIVRCIAGMDLQIRSFRESRDNVKWKDRLPMENSDRSNGGLDMRIKE